MRTIGAMSDILQNFHWGLFLHINCAGNFIADRVIRQCHQPCVSFCFFCCSMSIHIDVLYWSENWI